MTTPKIISVRSATGAQLQQAAKIAKLENSTNQIFGLYQAIFCQSPSPMQVKILQRGLSAVGINHLKVAETVVPATAVDLMPEELQVGINMLAATICDQLFGQPQYAVRVAGSVLYVRLEKEDWTSSARLAKMLAHKYKFARSMPLSEPKCAVYEKAVRINRHTCHASIEVDDDNLTLSVWRSK